MKNRLPVLMLLVFGAATATADLKESDASAPLGPMQRPAVPQTGSVWVADHSDGSRYEQKVTAVDGDTVVYEDNSGCGWSKPVSSFMFAPVTEWSNCEGGVKNGTQTIDDIKGDPWPLSGDTSFRYRYRGIGGSYKWNDTRRCKVDDEVRVSVPAGEFDTYKVVCKDRWSRRTWWMSPEMGEAVAYEMYHKRDHKRRYTLKLIKATRK